MLMLNYGSGLKIAHTWKQFLKYLNIQLTGDCWCSPFLPVFFFGNPFLFWLTFEFCLIIVVNCLHLSSCVIVCAEFPIWWILIDMTEQGSCFLWLWWSKTSGPLDGNLHVCVSFRVYILSPCFAELPNFLKTAGKKSESMNDVVFVWVCSECSIVSPHSHSLFLIKMPEGSQVYQQHLEEWMEACFLIVCACVCAALCVDILDFCISWDATPHCCFFLYTSVTPAVICTNQPTNEWIDWQKGFAKHTANFADSGPLLVQQYLWRILATEKTSTYTDIGHMHIRDMDAVCRWFTICQLTGPIKVTFYTTAPLKNVYSESPLPLFSLNSHLFKLFSILPLSWSLYKECVLSQN